MRIAIDAMGGDRAPEAPVAGALAALATYLDVELCFVGDTAGVNAEIERHEPDESVLSRVTVHHAPHVAFGEDPVRAVRNVEGNSARACADLLRAGTVEGVITMGNTGAAVAAATLFCRRLAGVRRLGIAVPFPRRNGATVVIDCGANPDARPDDLRQYAVMAAQYAHHALGVDSPRIGIMSIGEEEHKGNRLVAEAWERFKEAPVDGFFGNIEPNEIFEDRADVMVCDGFTGNIALKTAEGMAEYMFGMLPESVGAEHRAVVGEAARVAASRVDYAKYGGAPLLGVKGGYLIGHGRSAPEAFENAVGVMHAYVKNGVGDRIVAALAPFAHEESA